MQKLHFFRPTLVLVLMVFLAACTPVQNTTEPTELYDESATLWPYPSDTPTQTPLPTGYSSPTPSPTITPTWTPVFYNVKDSDDMFGIAFWYGISVEALKTANPTVNPYAMGVGTVLLIPLTPQAETTPRPTAIFTPTPTPKVSTPNTIDCYTDGNGGLICFALVENTTSEDMENVGGTMTLTESVNSNQQEAIAIMPLNLLKAGSALPIVAFFKGPLPEAYTISLEIEVMLPVMPNDDRYANLEIINETIGFDPNHESARVSGNLSLPQGADGVRSAWVLAIAYDKDRHVVGYRRWESLTPGALTAETDLLFTLNIYSLHGEIDSIVLVSEAKAILP